MSRRLTLFVYATEQHFINLKQMNMKKNSILMLVMTLIMALGMSQGVMAKEKKVKYLGHNYRGEVNDQKVPAGKGVMNVHGLMIEGVFSDHSVTNAEVWRTTYMGTSNTTFSGTITYDESENIVLKAGGVISTKYYQGDYHNSLESLEPYYIKETTKEDRVVNSNSLEPKELALPYDLIIKNSDYQQLNPPVFKASYTVGLTHVNNCKSQAIDMDVFCTTKYPERISVKNYKDDKGRIWNYSVIKKEGYRDKEDFYVKYPDGSYIKKNYDDAYSWEILYPDGKKIVFSTIEKRDNRYYISTIDLGKLKLFTKGLGGYEILPIFTNNLGKNSFCIDASCNLGSYEYDYYIKSDSIDLQKLSDKEMQKLLTEDLLPYFKKDVKIEKIGYYKDGKYTSLRQETAAQAKRDAAKQADKNKSIANFKKKYGFDPSVDDVRYIVKVGRNLLHILDARKEWVYEYGNDRNALVTIELAKDQGARKCYKFYWYNTAYYMGYFWTRNNVITSIHWGQRIIR